MATYSVTENAGSDSDGGWSFYGWGKSRNPSGGVASFGSGDIGAELPLTIGSYTIRSVGFIDWIGSGDEPNYLAFFIDGNHSGWPTDLQWVDTVFSYNPITIGETWTRTYFSGIDQTAWLLDVGGSSVPADYYEDGGSYSPVVTVSEAVIVAYQNGFSFNGSGYLVVTTSGAIDHYLHGLPFSAADSLCVEQAAVSYFHNGWPFTANNRIAIA